MQSLKTGRLERRDWDDINIALDVLSKANIHIDDTAGINIMEMKSKCRRLKAEEGLDLVVIDYLQLMTPEGKADSRTQEISVISRNLKLLARELDCPGTGAVAAFESAGNEDRPQTDAVGPERIRFHRAGRRYSYIPLQRRILQ